MGALWSMAIDISGLLDSSAPILGYRGGKEKTQATHGCVVPQFPTSPVSLPSFPFLSESLFYKSCLGRILVILCGRNKEKCIYSISPGTIVSPSGDWFLLNLIILKFDMLGLYVNNLC